jgi:serine/threonine protein kinase
LGSGAFGEVRKCVQKKTGAVRAVKIIKKSAMDTNE